MRTQFFTIFLFILACNMSTFYTHAQVCPANIDFEGGNFNQWQCYEGGVEALGNRNVITLYQTGAQQNRHTMVRADGRNAVDPFGGFPVNCPNGSGYSIRLGNSLAGTEAEGVSYTFKIPDGQDVYSLIYHYAVVFQDPNHEPFQQPRLEIVISNLTDNKVIDCSSFTFFATGTLLPGFFLSPNPRGGTPVWCKDWSAVSVNLNGNAGKTIQLFFKTADCTFRRHFGYAYVDVNSECSSEFVGSAYCRDDTAVNLTAPFGYSQYKWYNSSFTQQLGNTQSIRFQPVPPPGSTFAVTVVPFNGYGCPDTLIATLTDTLTLNARAGADTFSCNYEPVPIGSNYRPGLVYSWSPATGLSNPNVANPFASPGNTTRYILRTSNDGGGCADYDTVIVRASVIDSTISIRGSPTYCSDSGDSSILIVKAADDIQWYRNEVIIAGATRREHHAMSNGLYSALLHDDEGCTVETEGILVQIDDPVPGIMYPVEYAVIDQPMDLHARKIGDSVLWSPGLFIDNISTYDPVFQGISEQLYLIALKTNSGCLTIDTQLVKTVDGVEVYVPNAFTPNNDGLNDVLRPTLMGVKALKYFKIFNRWGQLIYQTATAHEGWDGTLRGAPQLSQVYAWIAEAVGVDDRIYTRRGSTVLVR